MNRKWYFVNRQNYGVWALGLSLIVGLAVRAAWSQLQATAPISNTLAKGRGCRTGGPGGLNQINPEWVSVQPADAPMIAQGVVVNSFVTREDAPNSHFSHDQNFDVVLDGSSNGLHSDANPVENGKREMEIEWETKFFPPEFWPVAGDRVWMMGRWVFDCGHPPYRTEIHPPLAVAFTRLEPTTFPGDTKPTLTNRCSIYIHGRGGYFDAPVAVRDYEFDIPLPPRPSLRHQVRAQVLGLPFGGPVPIITVPDATRVHVRYPLRAINDRSPDRKFGAVIAAGWINPLTAIGPPSPTFRVLRVTLDSIRINEDHDPDPLGFNNSGEWNLFLRAGSHWMQVTGLHDVDNGQTIRINKSVDLIVPDSGAVPVGIQSTGWEDDCDGNFGTIRSPSLGDLGCLVNGNDRIGFIGGPLESGLDLGGILYTKAQNFGIGSHDIASTKVQGGSADTAGDFNLRFRIEQIAVVNPPPVGPVTRG